MRKTLLAIIVGLFLSLPARTYAFYDPLSVSNNPFGIHIADTSQLPDAARLINTNGDWGYVTFVITKEERDKNRWQQVFDQARRLHLLPIVRIATKPQDDIWEKPAIEDIDGWVSFLNSLNWVVKNRYVIIGNEPNHAKEWGGEVNPKEYATYLKEFSTKLRQSSPDFFVLPAGLDASAPNSKETMDEAVFLREMLTSEADIFDYIDGWTSHAYPNPNFSGSEFASGRGTVRTYEWELAYLEGLGITKNLPVFITETGWAHNMGQENEDYLKPDEIGKKLKFAFENVWKNDKVVAVTPFVLSYLEPPFDIFSWKDRNGDFYSFYQEIQNLPKPKGEPLQETKGGVEAVLVFPLRTAGATFTGVALIKNVGQSIWNKNEIGLVSDQEVVEVLTASFEELEPGESGVISFRSKAPIQTGINSIPLWLERGGELFGETYYFKIATLPVLRNLLRLGF